MLKAMVATGILLFIVGCAFQEAQNAKRAQTETIGMTREQLAGCAGPPSQMQTIGGTEYWTYGYAEGGTTTVIPNAANPGLVPIVSQRFNCEAIISFRDGKVAGVNYRGDTGAILTKGEACGPILKQCLR